MSETATHEREGSHYPHVVQAISEPWAIMLGTLVAIKEVVSLRASGHRLTQEEIAARIGAGPARKDETRHGSVAVIPLDLTGDRASSAPGEPAHPAADRWSRRRSLWGPFLAHRSACPARSRAGIRSTAPDFRSDRRESMWRLSHTPDPGSATVERCPSPSGAHGPEPKGPPP